MKLDYMWTVIATIVGLSRRGDKWVAKPANGGKVILLGMNSQDAVSEGMTVPVCIHKELERCSFGRVETGVWVDGVGAWLPITTDFSDDKAIRKFAEDVKKKEAKRLEKHRADMAVYRAEQAERKLVAEKLLDLSTSKPDRGRYRSRIEKRSTTPLTTEENRLLVKYFELPPWGVTDHGDHIITDSFTD